MAKRKNSKTASPAGPIERRVLGIAEGVGWVAGKVVATTKRRAPAVAKPSRARKTRSGGTVDAPGKKHRKPAPADPLLARTKRAAPSEASAGRAASSAAKRTRRYARG